MCFSPYFGSRLRMGGSHGIGTHPAYAAFDPGQLKGRGFRSFFLYMVTTKNDHARYVKHVLANMYVFFTLFGFYVCVCGGGGVSQEIRTKPTNATFHLGQLKTRSFRNFFLIS